MDTMPVKPFLVGLLNQAREEELAFAAALNEDERAALGRPECWSATDTLAHIAAAKRRFTEALVATRRGEAPSLEHDERQIYAKNQGRAWGEVETEAQSASNAFIGEVEHLTDAELADGQRWAWLENRPLAAQILGYGVWHVYGHLTGYYRQRGDEARAAQTQEQLIDAVDRMERIPVVQGDAVSMYNMACIQATAGRHQKALRLLGEALRVDPDLRDNAKSDPDLEPLRGNPTFQMLAAL